MSSPKKPFNPFYVLLLLTGVVFCITACAFGVNAVVDLRGGMVDSSGESIEPTASSEAFAKLIDQYGNTALLVELGVLAVATFGVIFTDDYWTRRFEAKHGKQTENGS